MTEKNKEVSGLALSNDFVYLKSRGVDLKEFLRGLPYSYEHLLDENNWVDFQTFKEIIDRSKRHFRDEPDIMYKMGESIYRLHSMKFIRIIAYLIRDPYKIYKRIPKFVEQSFTFIHCEVEKKSDSHIQIVYEFVKYAPFKDFADHLEGTFVTPAKVGGFTTIESKYKIIDNRIIWDLFLVKKGIFIRIWNSIRRILFVHKAVEELDRSKNLLTIKYNELEIERGRVEKQLNNILLLKEFSERTNNVIDSKSLFDILSKFFIKQLNLLNFVIIDLTGDQERVNLVSKNGDLYLEDKRGNNIAEFNKPIYEELRRLNSVSFSLKDKKGRLFSKLADCFPMMDFYVVFPLQMNGKNRKKAIILSFVEQFAEEERYEYIRFLETFYEELCIINHRVTLIEEINTINENLEVTVRDRTKALQIANEKLKNLDKLKNDFILNLTYELRNPFNNILSSVQYIIQKNVDNPFYEQFKYKINVVHKNTLLLLHYINNLLEIQNIQELNVFFKYEKIYLKDLLEDCISDIEVYCLEKGIALIADLDGGLPVMHLDPGKIEKALMEVLINATKFTKKSGKIYISLVRKDLKQVIRIKDTGVGIPRDRMKVIFEIFSKIQSPREERYPGMGVGLHLAHSYVSLHGGSMGLESEEGQGSEFIINLPEGTEHVFPNLQERRHEQKGQVPISRRKEDTSILNIREYVKNPNQIPFINIINLDSRKEFRYSSLAFKHKYNVLIAYPDISFLSIACEILEDYFNIIASDKGDQVIEILKERDIDACVISTHLEKYTGENIFKIIKARPHTSRVPIIALSSHIDIEQRMKILHMGADFYMSVPIDFNELVTHINVLIEKHQLREQLEHDKKNLDQKVQVLSKGKEELFIGVVESLVNAIDEKDNYTRGHSVRVRNLVDRFCDFIDTDEELKRDVALASMFHDIGKIGIPDKILNKTDRLSFEEWQLIKDHPIKGVNILKAIKELKEVTPYIMFHHERWDGKGYPDGLQGEEIPYGARIISLCDSYDAMSSDRTYRKELPQKKILEEFEKNKNLQFDPELAETFLTFMMEDKAHPN